MLHKTLKGRKTKDSGFTIIEVLIVLAIAGLILLIVFLAVPALQRNSRNTQRKNEVAAILGGINEWSNNNNGSLPNSSAQQTAALQNAKTNFYTGAITWKAGTQTNTTGEDSVIVVTGAACLTDGTGSTGPGSGRQVAVMYTVETGGGTPQHICQES